MSAGPDTPGSPANEQVTPPLSRRVRRWIVGRPRDLADKSIFHRLALIPLLAWVGLGADGLSSSAYGPEEGFLALGGHPYLGLVLAVLCVVTVTVLSSSYSYIIEQFPAGGGGYTVASKLIGPLAGLISGCALLVDYVLTITVSISAAGDAIFSLLPGLGGLWKFLLEVWLIFFLTGLNLRGVKESILALLPVFVLFVITHVILIGAGIFLGVHDWLVDAPHLMTEGTAAGAGTGLGMLGTLLLLARAYSLGGGTYTGIEAVSNGMPMMREPRVRTGRRTMLYMAISLSITAGGLLVCFFLWKVQPEEGKTLNAVLAEVVGARLNMGTVFPFLTLLAEGLLLIVAAQAGFLDGPRILSNMAVDSWVPRRFAGLSERLTTQNGTVLVGGAALIALFYTRGNVDQLVVMYSVNVFLTFSLSMFAMLRYWGRRRSRKGSKRRWVLFGFSFALCVTVLTVTVYEKFMHGAWLTIVVTGCGILLCLRIRRHYRYVGSRLRSLDDVLKNIPSTPVTAPPLKPSEPTAAVLVGGYSGVGIHTLLSVVRAFPGHFKNFVFVSVGVVDSGVFKGADEIDALRQQTEQDVAKYVNFANANGMAATARVDIGTEVAAAAEEICKGILREFPRTVFFGGKVVFDREGWSHRLLHNETGYAVERRLHALGQTMVVLPVRVR